MRGRPILFNAQMVRALLAGTKTQTRRVVKGSGWEPHHLNNHRLIQHASHPVGLQAYFRGDGIGDWIGISSRYGQPGDRLWVRETWAQPDRRSAGSPPYVYGADWPGNERPQHRWRPSIHMPRAASRITLEITGVRVERLQDISEADAGAEGVEYALSTDKGYEAHPMGTYQEGYAKLWTEINGPGSWDANPWVWVLEFQRIKGGAA